MSGDRKQLVKFESVQEDRAGMSIVSGNWGKRGRPWIWTLCIVYTSLSLGLGRDVEEMVEETLCEEFCLFVFTIRGL